MRILLEDRDDCCWHQRKWISVPQSAFNEIICFTLYSLLLQSLWPTPSKEGPQNTLNDISYYPQNYLLPTSPWYPLPCLQTKDVQLDSLEMVHLLDEHPRSVMSQYNTYHLHYMVRKLVNNISHFKMLHVLRLQRKTLSYTDGYT